MQNLSIFILLASFIFTQQTTSYSWEDGNGTILGSFNSTGDLVSGEANVGSTNGISPYDGSRMLTVSESPLGGTPQAFLAWVTNLSVGESVTACFYGYDDTPTSPSMRIWGNWTDSNTDINEYSGSASGNNDYTNDSGWNQVCHTWTVSESEDVGLVIQARLYSGSDDPTVYFIDLIEVTAPTSSIINYPGGTDGLSGCTDATACNYNQFATEDDGSCTYPTNMSIYDIQYTLDQGEYCYESDYDQICVATTGTVTAVHPEYSNFYLQDDSSASSCDDDDDGSVDIGDLNGDGNYNILDIVGLANCVLAQTCDVAGNGCASDINEDGNYNVLDLVALANCVLFQTCGNGSEAELYTGIYVHNMSPTPSVGENITLIATVNEYYSLTQLIDGASFTVNSSGNSIVPIDISTGDLAACTETSESLESMLVRISNVTVSQTSNEFGEWFVDDGTGPCQIDNEIFDGQWLDPFSDQEFASIVGIVNYAYSEYSILPRTMSDITLCATCPIANAGEDQFVAPGTSVTLDASGSYDPNGSIIAYEWVQESGTPVFIDEESSITTFTAPSINEDLVFALTVYDDEFNGAIDYVTITVGTGTPIQDIQCPSDLTQGSYCYETSLAGDEVSTYGIVTHVLAPGHSSEGNFFLQQSGVNTCGGIFIRDFDIVPNIGDELTLSGSVNEYYSFTQIIDVTSSSISSENNVITPMLINTGDLGIDCSLSGEHLEGMLIQVNNVTVESIDEFGNIQINDGSGSTLIDDYYFDGSWPTISIGSTYSSITGVVGYSYSEFKIYPRTISDID